MSHRTAGQFAGRVPALARLMDQFRERGQALDDLRVFSVEAQQTRGERERGERAVIGGSGNEGEVRQSRAERASSVYAESIRLLCFEYFDSKSLRPNFICCLRSS